MKCVWEKSEREKKSQGKTAGLMSKHWTKQSSEQSCPFIDKRKRFFSSPKYPVRLWGSSRLLFHCFWVLYPGGRMHS